MTYIALAVVVAGLLVAIRDDMHTRRRNEALKQSLENLSEQLIEADAQCVAYMETIARERQGSKWYSKG